MSKWYEPKLEFKDIWLDDDEEEIHVLFDQDEDGNCYVSLKVRDIKRVLKEKIKLKS